MSDEKIPEVLDAIVDKVLAYRPKPKTEAAKSRRRKATKIKREKQNSAASAPS